MVLLQIDIIILISIQASRICYAIIERMKEPNLKPSIEMSHAQVRVKSPDHRTHSIKNIRSLVIHQYMNMDRSHSNKSSHPSKLATALNKVVGKRNRKWLSQAVKETSK